MYCLCRHPELVLEARGSPGELVTGDDTTLSTSSVSARTFSGSKHLGRPCSAIDALPSRVAGEEGAIYHNIETPQLSPRAQVVMFVIHSPSLRYGGCQHLALSPSLNLHSTAARRTIIMDRKALCPMWNWIPSSLGSHATHILRGWMRANIPKNLKTYLC